MRKRKINVAVTGLNAIDSPGPGIPVIRALRESRDFEVRVIGLSYETLEPGIYMHDLVDKTYQLPLPLAGEEVLLTRIKYIHAIEKLDMIIPNFDAELFNFIKLEQSLLKMGIQMFVPTVKQFESRLKVNLNEFGKKNKVKVPHSKLIFSAAEIFSLSQTFTYPVVVKGKYYDAYTAYSPDQVNIYFNKIASKWGLPIVIQEYVQGTEVNVTALGDGRGNTIGAVPMRKQFVTDKGKAWAGISIDDKVLVSLTRRLIKATKWRGGIELEMIKTSDEIYYLIEINPRFPAWIHLATACGQNHPEALVKLALGKTPKPFTKYDVGKMFIRFSYDLIVSLGEFERISTVGEL